MRQPSGTPRDETRRRVLDAAQRAERWLLESGIYVSDRGDPNYGAVYSYYDPKRKRHELVYAEATGYVISFLRYLSAVDAGAPPMDRARASGDWLARLAARHDGVITIGHSSREDIAQAYAFDNGICCKGLLDLYEMTGEAAYLACAERIADWITGSAMSHDGSVKPVFDTRAREFTSDGGVWYKASGSFHAKIAMSLLQLYAISGREPARDAAVRLCGWAVRQQRPDGAFPANLEMNAVNLHAHCYTVEALLFAYASQRIEEFADAASRAARWMTEVQRPDGSFRLWYENGSGRERASYPQAQAVRIFSLLNMLKPQAALADAGRRAAEALLTMQSAEPDTRACGGFLEGDIRRYRLVYRPSRNATSWATMFAIQALNLVTQIDGGDFAAEIRWLF